uniref:Uncharacterized protein n=1 Tax=Panagrolaimus sp. JU765 TaxID=591449 RepID=A0AC34R6Y2_9BILA
MFSGKVVIVTGSSAGIGQATAVLFAKNGASVTIHGRSEEKLKETVKLIEKAGGSSSKVLMILGEITDKTVQANLINKTIEKFGKLDVLVNNAGIARKSGSEARDLDNLDYVLDVNLKAPIALTELAIPHLEKTKGNVVNVSSVAGQKAVTDFPFYSITKAGLDHFAINYAALLAAKGIRVNNLSPGLTITEFASRHGIPPQMLETIMKQYVSVIPLQRAGTSEEMAEFIAFIASDKASYMTGQIIAVDGGILVHTPSPKFEGLDKLN